jgi:hypothetical protein
MAGVDGEEGSPSKITARGPSGKPSGVFCGGWGSSAIRDRLAGNKEVSKTDARMERKKDA